MLGSVLVFLGKAQEPSSEPIARLNQELDSRQLRIRTVCVGVPRGDHERMTLHAGAKTSSREPYVDVLSTLNFPRPRDLDVHPDSPLDRIHGGAGVATAEREIPVNGHDSLHGGCQEEKAWYNIKADAGEARSFCDMPPHRIRGEGGTALVSP